MNDDKLESFIKRFGPWSGSAVSSSLFREFLEDLIRDREEKARMYEREKLSRLSD